MLDSVLKAYQSPTRMVHAIGALSALGKEAAGLNVKRPLVVTDQGIVKAGLLDEALKPLRAEGLDPVTYDQVRANPGIALVAFYTLAGMFGWPLLVAAILGLFEAWLGLRRRLAPHGVHLDG